MKKKTPANTSGSENSGWESSENLDATSVLHPADVHAAATDNAPTTVFSSDETAVLSDYQDPTAVLSDYQDATQVLTSHETATPAATHSDDRTKVLTDYGSSPANKTAPAGSMNTGSANAESANTEVISSHPDTSEVIGATRPLPRAYRAPIKIPETIPSPQERASQGNYSADEPMQATRRLDPPKPPVSGFPLNNQMGASPMGAPQMGAQQPLPTRAMPPQAPPQPVAYPPEAYPAAAYPNGAYVQTGQVPVDASGRPVNRPGEEQGHHLPSSGILMRHVMALLFLGLSLYGAFVFFIYTATGQQVDEQAYTEYAHQFKSYRGPTLTALDSLPTIVGVIAVLGLVAVLIWKHRFLPSLIGVLAGAAAVTSTYLLKHYLIVKPDLGVQEALSNSAPSGHTTFAAAAGAALFLAAPRFLRPTVALCAALATCLTGASTIINGWHRPADVVTAILVTAIWTVVGMGVLRYVRPADFAVPARGGLVLVPLMTIATLFLSFCAVILYLIAIFAPIPGGAFTAATCMIIAVSFGTTALMVNLLRPRNSNRSAYSKVWSYQ
ncbi:phosphatase PAP2 family protein [Rothia mucilaginosa]|uniref:phosphatase PAP2 family protein n=1 Tax=Rothia mucilaginosa TaxID=43675 RepID=UPI001CAB0BAB|nr:phosphatase PAP2 family protein [Rothia mucilaginosa]MBF1641541.1 phosphatase PAP2 family protein [Rothia mucilaginosa]UQF83331.1 MAG: phosphatase PAP2 family protein [Rothia mucilaginosa]